MTLIVGYLFGIVFTWAMYYFFYYADDNVGWRNVGSIDKLSSFNNI